MAARSRHPRRDRRQGGEQDDRRRRFLPCTARHLDRPEADPGRPEAAVARGQAGAMMKDSGAPDWDAVIAAPGFALGIRTADDALTLIEFLPPRSPQAARTLLAAEATRQIDAYLRDARHRFD